MQIFCIEEFKCAFEKLVKKRPYRDVEMAIIDHFFDKNLADLCSGIRLNNSEEMPYIKKRLNGSGGYRIYYYVIIKNHNIYLMFVHPKIGDLGSSNITDESKSHIYKKVLECIKDNKLYVVSLSESRKKLLFTKK